MSLPQASAAKADLAAPAKPDDLKGRLEREKLKYSISVCYCSDGLFVVPTFA